jgi:hypothetical protein
MCRDDKGIAALYSSYKGRIKNVRVGKNNAIIADFYERTSQTPIIVKVNELKFPHNKAQKSFDEIYNAVFKKRSKHSADIIMS